MPTVVQDVSGDSALQAAIAALKAKIEGGEESGEIAQLVSQIDLALAGKQNILTFDSAPSSGSSNPVTSGGVKTALDGKQDTLTFDSTPTAGSTKPVTSSGVKTALDGKQDTLIFDAEPTAESTKPVTSGGVKQALDDMHSEIGDRVAAAEEDIDISGSGIYESASGSIVSVSDGADNKPMKSAAVSIEPIQEGEGDPSPENVRPISGRTGLSVVRTGKNLVDDSIKRINAANTIVAIGGGSGEYYLFLYPGVYTLSCKFADGVHYGALYKDANSSQVAIWTTSGTDTKASFTISKAGLYRLWFYRSSGDGGVSVDNVSDVLLELGSEATEYEPYKGNTYSVDWESEAGTVYGATLDVVSGKLVVDRTKITANMLNWSYQADNNRFYALIQDMIGGKYTVRRVPFKCSKALCIDDGRAVENVPYNSIYGAGSSRTVYIKTEINNINDFISTFGDAEIVYELDMPTEIQLTPQEVRTLLGENNIWSDGGDISVEYPADTKTYIDAFSVKTVEISSQTPTITAEENTRYICGEVTSLTFTPCASGICDVRFTAASISTVLALPQTLKLPDWFDPTALEANTTYEINVVDGIYGAVISWA